MKFTKSNFLFKLLYVTIAVNWVIPKAGIKIMGIPVTIGLVLFLVLEVSWIICGGKVEKRQKNYLIVIMQLYFLIRFIIAFGCREKILTISGFFLPLVIFPTMYFMSGNIIKSNKEYHKTMKMLYVGFLIICIYSLIQLVVGIEKTTIPGITVNLSDYRKYGTQWYMNKNNGVVDGENKIVGTYQNGNLLGENILIYFPIIYDYLIYTKKKTKATMCLILFFVVEIITLSRTCWIGMILFILFRLCFNKNMSIKSLLNKILLLIMSIIGMYLILKYIPSVSKRVFNTDIDSFLAGSGRTEGAIIYLKSIFKSKKMLIGFLIGSLGIIEYEGLAYEMTALAIFRVGGIIGLMLFYGVIFNEVKIKNKRDPISNSYRISTILWLIYGLIEGGLWLLPLGINLFFMLGLGEKYNEKLMEK